MAVDLSDLIPNLKLEIDAPGVDSFATATDDDFTTLLENAFWEAVLDGVIPPGTYTESDGIVTPVVSGGPDLPRQTQQLIIFYAGYKAIFNAMRNIQSQFRAKAGAVEYEVQYAAGVLRQILVELGQKKTQMITSLGELGLAPAVYVDAICARTASELYGVTEWVGNRALQYGGPYDGSYYGPY